MSRRSSPPPDPSAPALLPDLPADWRAALAVEFASPEYAELSRFVAAERAAGDVFPAEPDVFAALRLTPLTAVRVVILGQDPYPTPGHAHGLAFSVQPGVKLPGSLRNIYKELQSDLGIPPAKHGHLTRWAEQGVLLLNSVLTVRSGAAASHANKGWERLTDAVLAAVNALPHPVVFVLWGAYAQKKARLIDPDRHVLIASAHPSPLSARNGFFGSRPFSKVNEALTRLGQKPIDWRVE
ncbi:MAG: uracil-DNA glycosylase [Gemmataceae bacterium]